VLYTRHFPSSLQKCSESHRRLASATVQAPAASCKHERSNEDPCLENSSLQYETTLHVRHVSLLIKCVIQSSHSRHLEQSIIQSIKLIHIDMHWLINSSTHALINWMLIHLRLSTAAAIASKLSRRILRWPGRDMAWKKVLLCMRTHSYGCARTDIFPFEYITVRTNAAGSDRTSGYNWSSTRGSVPQLHNRPIYHWSSGHI